ncbi:hypothetical protein ACFL0L_04380 [Patescibacteria group bacterium]
MTEGEPRSQPGETNEGPSLEELRQNSSDLQRRATELRVQQQKIIDAGVKEIEGLIDESRKLHEQLTPLRIELASLAEQFETIKKSGTLEPDEERQLTDLQETVAAIEKQDGQISTKITQVYGRPGVAGEIQGKANKEHIQFEANAVLDSLKTRYEDAIQLNATNLLDLGKAQVKQQTTNSRLESDLSDSRRNLGILARDAVKGIKKDDIRRELEKSLALQSGETSQQYRKRIEGLLNQYQGMGKGKQRKAINTVLESEILTALGTVETQHAEGTKTSWDSEEETLVTERMQLLQQVEKDVGDKLKPAGKLWNGLQAVDMAIWEKIDEKGQRWGKTRDLINLVGERLKPIMQKAREEDQAVGK